MNPAAEARGAAWPRIALAVGAAAALVALAVPLARVDADVGAPTGADRLISAIDADPSVDADDILLARDVLRARPIDGAAYRVLAQHAQAARDEDHADRLYAIAARRAPRDVAARAALADRAFADDDVDTALTHVDALLRVAPHLRADVLGELAPYLGEPHLRNALVQRLAADPPWRAALPAMLSDDRMPAADAEALLAALAIQLEPSRAELDARMAVLERLGRATEARALWLESVGEGVGGADLPVFDGGFERDGVDGRYGWQFDAPPGVTMAVEAGASFEGTRALAIGFDGRAVRFAGLRQRLALPPGRYRLAAAVRNDVDASRPFAWRLACVPGGTVLADLPLPTARRDAWQPLRTGFEVPADCGAQLLQLHHAARSLDERRLSGTLHVDAIAITADAAALP